MSSGPGRARPGEGGSGRRQREAAGAQALSPLSRSALEARAGRKEQPQGRAAAGPLRRGEDAAVRQGERSIRPRARFTTLSVQTVGFIAGVVFSSAAVDRQIPRYADLHNRQLCPLQSEQRQGEQAAAAVRSASVGCHWRFVLRLPVPRCAYVSRALQASSWEAALAWPLWYSFLLVHKERVDVE